MEAVSLVHNERTVLIDTSTAHRVQAGWTYGFPELPGQRERIAASRRIANPGCHASGFVALVAPLVEAGLLAADARLSCFSLTGYSGGGKKMIAEYEAQERSPLLDAPRMYALDQQHKHLPEMGGAVRACARARIQPRGGGLFLRHGGRRSAMRGHALRHAGGHSGRLPTLLSGARRPLCRAAGRTVPVGLRPLQAGTTCASGYTAAKTGWC